jgi:hypothetical protein
MTRQLASHWLQSFRRGLLFISNLGATRWAILMGSFGLFQGISTELPEESMLEREMAGL